jgi:voltage-gated potassium channel
MPLQKRLLWLLTALAGIVIGGTVGYMIIEGWSFLDAIYMTVTTITTVGYDEVNPLSTAGRIFSIFLIIGGMGGAFYALYGVVEYILSGYFRTTMWRRRMKARIVELKDHFVLCGYGKVGQEIARAFADEGVPFVIIDKSKDAIATIEPTGYLYLLGDATSDDVLKEAGIERARGLVSAVDSDAENTYITLSGRQLNPKLFIAARGSDAAGTKLKRAGADRIVSPHSIGGRRMAMLALRPAVVDFIDTVTYRQGRELQLENVDILASSPLAGLMMGEAQKKTGVTVLAMRKKEGKLIPNPQADEILMEGDRLIVIGTKKRLANLEKSLEGA